MVPDMTRALILSSLALVVAGCVPKRPPEPAAASSSTSTSQVDPIDKNLPRPDIIAKSAPLPGFARGINLGNCYDAPREGAWGTVDSTTGGGGSGSLTRSSTRSPSSGRT